MGAGELERIAILARRFARDAPGVLTGIGDDAAVLRPPEGRVLVWTVDQQVEGTHFRRDLCSWADEGWRSFMAAASDLAAMGARPWCALSALALPADLEDEAFDALTEGQRLAAEAVSAPIVGGNLSAGPVVSITTTLLGTGERIVERRGARPGDGVWLAGAVGLARAGLLALEQKLVDARLRPAIAAWLRPQARIEEGRAMGKVAHAGIDVSDGLAQDAGHLAEAGNVCIVLEESALLSHGGEVLARAAEALGIDPLELALRGGEDYALVAASDVPVEGFSRVGQVRGGADGGGGVVLKASSGEERVLGAMGFDHFRPFRP